jgi:hypothetical protein
MFSEKLEPEKNFRLIFQAINKLKKGESQGGCRYVPFLIVIVVFISLFHSKNKQRHKQPQGIRREKSKKKVSS